MVQSVVQSRLDEMAGVLQERLREYGPERSRLILRVLRQLGRGSPVTPEAVSEAAEGLTLTREEAQQFLGQVAEHDSDGQILGLLGLSLNEHPHRFNLDGQRFTTWCAEDTLFLPALLGQTAAVESFSPLSGEPVRLKIGPERVEAVDPAEAVLTMVIVNARPEELDSVESIWDIFCRHVHFFPYRQEAERWATGREDIAILTPQEGFELGKRVWASALLQEG